MHFRKAPISFWWMEFSGNFLSDKFKAEWYFALFIGIIEYLVWPT